MIVAVGSMLVVVVLLVVVGLVTGRAVLVLVGNSDRPLSSTTIVGIAAVVLWSCLISLVVAPGSWAGVALVAAGIAALVTAAIRRPTPLMPERSARLPFVGSLAAGFAAIAPLLVVVAQGRSTALVHLTGNHDAFFFTAVPDWLMQHRSVGGPGVSRAGTPGGVSLVGSTWDIYQANSVRFGSEALTASIARVLGADPLNVWLPVVAGFQALFVLGAHRMASAFGRPGWRAAAVAVVVGTSSLALGQVLDQHSPTVLAAALALVLVVEVAAFARPSVAEQAERHSPEVVGTHPIVIAVLAGGLLAIYGELAVLIGPALVALVIAHSIRRGRLDARRWGEALGWTVLIAAPTIWRAVRGSARTQPPQGFISPYGTDEAAFSALRQIARGPSGGPVTWADSPWSTRIAVAAFVLAVVLGLVAVIGRGRHRAWWGVLATTAGAGWIWFDASSTSGYPQARWVEWAVPLLLLGALLGWQAIADGAVPPRMRAIPRPAIWGTAALAVAVIAAPGLGRTVEIRDHPSRRVDGAFTAAANWIEERDPTGADTVVWAQDYFTNLWTPYVNRRATATSYLSIYFDYYALQTYGPTGGRRWLLEDRAAFAASEVPADAVVESNERFVLVDLERGPVRVAVSPAFDGRWSADGTTVDVTLGPTTATCMAGDIVLPCP